ncbi:MFS transporter [Methanospirillum stamsii]|uniref:MFS transporter n=1 Tax=Methanospirillum stamsii TaxID=1277351 RepID=A0A2V2NKN6_9EURY|nr:MFS transporter [Methanospirillum stamsii]PWR75903.1 MFS transporter [Methanospirillum stamsii]
MSLTDRAYIVQLSIIGFLAIFSTTISKNPVLPLYASSLGANDALIGLISAISPLAGILLSFPVGVISDRLGRRRMLLFAGGVFLVAPLLYLFITDPFMLIPVRFFHGMATAILGPVVSAIIAERFSSTKGERIGQYSSATLYGRTVAPLVGGLLISFFAITPGLFRYQSVYLAAFIAGLIVCLLIFRIPGDKKGLDVTLTFDVFVKSLQVFWADSRLRATAYVDMGTYFIFGAFETFFPVYLVSQGFEVYLIGIFFAVQVLSIALTKPFFGKMADKQDPRYQIMAGLMLLGLSVFLIPFCRAIILLLILTLTSGIGMSLSTVATTKYIADIARKEEMGASMGALSSIMDIGHSSGPFVTGVIITASGYGMGFLSGLLLAIAITVYFMMMTINRKKIQCSLI